MNIPQIKLLAFSHDDTARTGTGCFMNVIAYLNGEPTITDESECVCYVMRPLAIWANDWMTDAERPALLPFLLRAMGSRTDDRAEITRRLALVVEFANKQRDYAAEYAAKSAAKYAEYANKSAKSAAEYAKSANKSAAKSATKYAAKSAADYAAKSAAKYAKYAEYAKYRKANVAAILALFDAAFPQMDAVSEITLQRVRTLESITA